MKIILVKDVGGVGQHNTIKEVSDGYALNYLIPRGLAIQATPDKVKKLEESQSSAAHSSTVRELERAAQIKAANGKRVVVAMKANEQGHLFKGLKKADVAHAIANMYGAHITSDTIEGMADAIKEVGEYPIEIAAAGAKATVTLVVEAAL